LQAPFGRRPRPSASGVPVVDDRDVERNQLHSIDNQIVINGNHV
jgi:hypothetical protein